MLGGYSDLGNLKLARFKGRPGEISPKARFWMFAGWVLPSRFRYLKVPSHKYMPLSDILPFDSNEAPFDRHDWIVRRPATGEEVRYVIDYYSAPDDADGSPVFSLDVRPALDSLTSIKERIAVATEEAWSAYTARGSQLPVRDGGAA